MLALLGWQLGHGTALQPWPSTLSSTTNSAEHPLSDNKTPIVTTQVLHFTLYVSNATI